MSIWIYSEDTKISFCCSAEPLPVCINPPWSTGESWDVCAFSWAYPGDIGMLRCHLSFRCQSVWLLVTELKGPTGYRRSSLERCWQICELTTPLVQLSARIETNLKQCWGPCDLHKMSAGEATALRRAVTPLAVSSVSKHRAVKAHPNCHQALCLVLIPWLPWNVRLALAVSGLRNASCTLQLLVSSRKTAILVCVLWGKLLCPFAEVRPRREKELLLFLAWTLALKGWRGCNYFKVITLFQS